MKIKKRSIVTFLLLVAMVATMCVGYVSAHGMEEVAATSDDLYHNFWLMCPAGGTTDLATEQKKEIDTSYAYYDLKPVTNTTGLSFYVMDGCLSQSHQLCRFAFSFTSVADGRRFIWLFPAALTVPM